MGNKHWFVFVPQENVNANWAKAVARLAWKQQHRQRREEDDDCSKHRKWGRNCECELAAAAELQAAHACIQASVAVVWQRAARHALCSRPSLAGG